MDIQLLSLDVDFRWIYIPAMAKDERETRRHSSSVLVRLTEEQLELVDRAAEATGLNRTGWVRMTLLQAAKQQLGEGG